MLSHQPLGPARRNDSGPQGDESRGGLHPDQLAGMLVPVIVKAVLLVPEDRIDLVGQQGGTHAEPFRVLRLAELLGHQLHRPELPVNIAGQIDPFVSEFVQPAGPADLVVHPAVVGTVPDGQPVAVEIAVAHPVIDAQHQLFVIRDRFERRTYLHPAPVAALLQPGIVARLPGAQLGDLGQKRLEMLPFPFLYQRTGYEAVDALLVQKAFQIGKTVIRYSEIAHIEILEIQVPVVHFMVGIPGQQLPPVGLVQHDAASRYIPVHLFDPAQEVVPGPDFILADDLSERFCRRLSLHMGQQKGAENRQAEESEHRCFHKQDHLSRHRSNLRIYLVKCHGFHGRNISSEVSSRI